MLLSGCLRGPIVWERITFNEPLSVEDVNFIEDGETSLPEVVERLGAPNEMVRSGEGVVARYHFLDGKNFKANYGWGLRFLIPFYAPDIIQEGGGAGTDVFQVRPCGLKLRTQATEISRIAGCVVSVYNPAL